MKSQSAQYSVFGDLQWLSVFQSDEARLAAIAMISLTIVLVVCLPTVVRVWAQDRRDRRAHERSKQALLAKIDDEMKRREAERLNLDA